MPSCLELGQPEGRGRIQKKYPIEEEKTALMERIRWHDGWDFHGNWAVTADRHKKIKHNLNKAAE